MRYTFLVSLTGVFSCIMPGKLARKARLKVCGKLPHPVFKSEKKPTLKPKLTSAGAYREFVSPLFHTYMLYLPLKNLLMWVSVYEQTNIDT